VKVTKIRTRIRISNLKEAEGEDKIIKPAYNATIVKSMGAMDLNAERRKKINT
jgi:hypothetical protein